ncbi:MAG TPA: hypothetical protein VF615_07265 [Longimicrobiaceae bacterium]|jgi:formaldehyde-activating enzyme involved in methanogenesis
MSPRNAPKPRRLVLNRETIRDLQDLAAVRFGPHTSETQACCPSIADTVAPSA